MTVNYARAKMRPIVFIHPDTVTFSEQTTESLVSVQKKHTQLWHGNCSYISIDENTINVFICVK